MLIPFVNRFLHWGAVGIVSPVLVLMAMSKGAPLEGVGVVMAAMSIAAVALELPSGMLSDLLGRKRVYLASLAISLAGYALMLSARSMAAVCAAASIYGVARAFSSGSIEALYIDSFIERRGKERLPALMTAMGVGETLGLAVGALAGGFIPMLWARLAPSADPYDGNLIAQAAIAVALFALTALSSPVEARRSGKATTLRSLVAGTAAVVRDIPVISRLLAGAVFWGVSFSAIEAYWQPRLGTVLGGAEASWLFGLVGALYFGAAIAGNALAGTILGRSRRVSGLAMAGVMRVAVGGAILALAAQRTAPGFVALFLTVMCCNGMMSVPEATALNAATPSGSRASMLSLSSLAVQAGGIVSSLLSSAALRVMPIRTVWLAAGALLLGSSALYLGLGRRTRVQAGSVSAPDRSDAGNASVF